MLILSFCCCDFTLILMRFYNFNIVREGRKELIFFELYRGKFSLLKVREIFL